MSELVLTSAMARGLGPLNARFTTGLHVVLARAESDLATLSELAAGVLPARRGRVSLDGDELGRTPARRREVAALLADEELLAASDVQSSLGVASALRGVSVSSAAALADAGLSELAPRDPRALDARERRSIALAFALAQSSIKVLILCDPLALAPEVDQRFVLARCQAQSRSAVVIVVVSSLADAMKVGGHLWWIDRGRLQAESAVRRPSFHPAGLVVTSPAARELARDLETDPAVSAVRFDGERAPSELGLRGPNLEALSTALARVSHALGASIDGIRPELPTLDSVLLARAGWVHPSYHARLEGKP